MKFSFAWADVTLEPDDTKIIEENIKNEVSHLQSMGARQGDMSVMLSLDATGTFLIGLARDFDREVAVSFVYSLLQGHLAKYESHVADA